METNAALLISNRYFELLAKFSDSRWRSDHQVISCHAWVVRNVVDEHIRLCAIVGTKRNECLDAFFYEQPIRSSLAALVFGWRRFRVTNASILATVVRKSSKKEREYYLLSCMIIPAFLLVAELVFLGF